ncbi:hypothetical protein RF11_15513 [Thelohanellus kitauei]|uniref:Sortilin C-terminal domain-containing protein n=1 Tax=Thelohanellus kitauei TaxID=669202 RepID=A0A0C2JTX4_THEKT|nr:hypothetical protein RF11_15513 [Thelohanellus kitauei]
MPFDSGNPSPKSIRNFLNPKFQEYLEKYNLRYKFWKDAPNYWLLFFYEKKTESTVSNQILLVSKDGGVSFNRWRPTYNEKPLSVDKFFAAKSAVFGLSEVNQTFFYADKDLNIFFAQRYDENESIILSNFDLAYVIKIVVKEFDPLNKNRDKRILYMEISTKRMTKIIRLHISEMQGIMPKINKFYDYFYFHGNHYILAKKNPSMLCLYTLNQYNHLTQIVCNLSISDLEGDRCPVVFNPHLPGVIYANLKNWNDKTRSYISLDNGKSFKAIEYKLKNIECHDQCRIELDLKCSTASLQNQFPEPWIVKFRGKFHTKRSVSCHYFFSFDAGIKWIILNSNIKKMIIGNRGGLMFATQSTPGRIWYSYNEGWSWHFTYVYAHNIIFMEPLSYPDNLVITAINYDMRTNIYSLFLFNFSNVLSSLALMIDKTCKFNDFERWYVPRFYGDCFRGQDISYLKKEQFVMCYDNRKEVIASIKPCPCSIEDFQW